MRRLAPLTFAVFLLFVSTSFADTFVERSKQSIGPKHAKRYDRLHTWATKEFGRKTVGRDVVRFGMPKPGPGNRLVTKAEFADTMSTLLRWRYPPAPPVEVATATTTQDYSGTSDTSSYSGGNYSIPTDIVMCESGGDYNASNPSGAYGAYQIMPGTAQAYGCSLATPQGQDDCAAQIWNGGAGRSNWVC